MAHRRALGADAARRCGGGDRVRARGRARAAAGARRRDRARARVARWSRSAPRWAPPSSRSARSPRRAPTCCPRPLVEELALLRDRVPPFSVRRRARAPSRPSSAGRSRRVFAAFEPEPVAAASVAQVHRAVLRDDGRGGRGQGPAARHPREGAARPLDPALRRPRASSACVPSLRLMSLEGALRAFCDAVEEQIHLTNEAAHNRRFRPNFADDPDVALPAPRSGRVLRRRAHDGVHRRRPRGRPRGARHRRPPRRRRRHALRLPDDLPARLRARRPASREPALRRAGSGRAARPRPRRPSRRRRPHHVRRAALRALDRRRRHRGAPLLRERAAPARRRTTPPTSARSSPSSTTSARAASATCR